jgi:hypothetical protein
MTCVRTPGRLLVDLSVVQESVDQPLVSGWIHPQNAAVPQACKSLLKPAG